MPVSAPLARKKHLADALRQLGLTAEDLATRRAARQAIAAAEAKDPALARAALEALDDVDLRGVRAVLGGGASRTASAAAAVARGAPAQSGTGDAALRRLDVEAALPARAPEVMGAATIYGLKPAALERPLERALVHVGRLHAALSKDLPALLDVKTANDVRRHAFMLQGLLRIAGSSKKTEKALARVKELEDAIGAFDYATAMTDAAAKHGLDPRARALLAEHVERARAGLRAVLVDGWLPQGGVAPRLQNVVDAFVDLDLPNEKKHAAKLREDLAELIEGVADKAGELDMSKLEKGLHELRRALRWIPITFMALDGLVVLDDAPGPIAAFEKLKKDPIARSPFASLPPSAREQERIAVPRSLFLALSKAVADLGDLKDQGQLVTGFAEVLEEAGVCGGKKEAKKAAEALVGEPGRLDRIDREGEVARTALVDSGLLPALARAVEGRP